MTLRTVLARETALIRTDLQHFDDLPLADERGLTEVEDWVPSEYGLLSELAKNRVTNLAPEEGSSVALSKTDDIP